MKKTISGQTGKGLDRFWVKLALTAGASPFGRVSETVGLSRKPDFDTPKSRGSPLRFERSIDLTVLGWLAQLLVERPNPRIFDRPGSYDLAYVRDRLV